MYTLTIFIFVFNGCLTIPLPGLEEPKPTQIATNAALQYPNSVVDLAQLNNNFNQQHLSTYGNREQQNNGNLENTDTASKGNNWINTYQNNIVSSGVQTKGDGHFTEQGVAFHESQNGNTEYSNNPDKQTMEILFALSHMSGLELLQYLNMKSPKYVSEGGSNNIAGKMGQTIQNGNQNHHNAITSQAGHNQQTINSIQSGLYNQNSVNHETMLTNPGYMISGGHNSPVTNGNTNGEHQNAIPNQSELISASVSNNGNAYFDPDKLMHTMLIGNESPFNPSTYNVKQNYIDTQGWKGYTGQGSSSRGHGTNQLVQGQINAQIQTSQKGFDSNQNTFDPNSLNGAQMNFKPVALMMAPGAGKTQPDSGFSFNPDKLNTFGGKFKPGQISPITASQLQVPNKNDQSFLFNADLINKKVTGDGHTTYLQQKQQEQQRQQAATAQIQPNVAGNSNVVGSNTMAGMNFFPSSFMTHTSDKSNFGSSNFNPNKFMQSLNQGSVMEGTEQTPASKDPMQQKKEQIGASVVTENAFPKLQSAATWGSMPGTYDKLFGDLLFDANAVNQKQEKFNPDKIMQSWIKSHGIQKPETRKSPFMSLLEQNELQTAQNIYSDANDNIANNSTPVTLPATSTAPSFSYETTTVPAQSKPSTATSTSIMSSYTLNSTSGTTVTPVTTTGQTTVETTTSGNGNVGDIFQTAFNPDAINSAMGQMSFNPGNILGYGGPPNMDHSSSQYSSFYNPDSLNTATINFNSGGLSMMPNGYPNGLSSNDSKKNDSNQSPFNLMEMGSFNPAKVNQISMNFDLKQQMGFPSSSKGDPNMYPGMYDPLKTNMQSVNSPFVSDNSSSGGNPFFSGSGMTMMSSSGFSGNFDPDKVNAESIKNRFGSNNSFSFMSSGKDYLKQFLGMGSTGNSDNSAFISNFDPASVNKAVFDPTDVNKIHMNFDPSEMLEKNPGYDKTKAEKYTFNPNKINDMKMNFQPAFISQLMSSDKKKDHAKNTTTDTKNIPRFIPGLLSAGNGNFPSFNPNTVNNNAVMHFSPGDILNHSLLSSDNSADNNTDDKTGTSSAGSKQDGMSFDPVAVNNGQMNFNPSAMMMPALLKGSKSDRTSIDSDNSEKDVYLPFLSHKNSEKSFDVFGSDDAHIIGASETGE